MIRQAEKKDLTRVMEIKEAVVPLMVAAGNTQWSSEYPNAQRFNRDIESGTLYVYESDEEIAGFVVVDDEHPKPYEEISWEVEASQAKAMHRMAVDPGVQGQGIARKMMEAIAEVLEQQGIKGIHTDTSLENERMQKQFERNGYHYRGKLHLDDNIEDWYIAYEKTF
ncbi:GNAT family N-acetyltransferase [Salinicoccus jeotgali]|uniref:GNAT family N-acetyltransferase n=1 Tax=Salinicoccus jeotgali TaxID=381634 RepID=A0ABP7EZN8_9STAP